MAGVYEIYSTTPSGVSLYWTRHDPVSGTKWPAIIMLHAGGYKGGGNDNNTISEECAAAGFIVFGAEYRLAPPATPMTVSPGGHPNPGQDTASDSGYYPKQTTDVQTVIRAVRGHTKCDGRVYVMGGSAGGSHTAYMCATGALGDDRPDLAVIFSCGVSNLADLNLLGLTAIPGETDPRAAIANYLNITSVWPAWTGGDLALCATASPVTYMTSADLPPMFILMSSMDSLGIPTSTGIAGSSDQGPPETLVDGGLIPKLRLVGLAESTAIVPEYRKFKKQVVPTTVHSHAFEHWSKPYDGVVGHTTVGQTVITWLQGGIPAGVAPILRGVNVGISHGTVNKPATINPSILADPNVDCIGLNVHWNEFETSEGTYDYTADNFLTNIKAIVAAGKKVQLTVTTMAGSTTFGGNTPNWVFNSIGGTPAGNPQQVLDGVTTAASPTVTAPSGNFCDADLFRAISGANIPANTYIGIVNSAISIGLSNSKTSNSAVNATGSGNPVNLTLAGRQIPDAATTSGSATVTSALGTFRSSDLHLSISGTNIPANTYIGIINSATSIGLSSSAVINTPVFASATGAAINITLGGRSKVAFNDETHAQVYGAAYSYNDKNPNHGGDPATTFPVFWEPTFLQKKKQMLNRLGNEITNGTLLTQGEKAAIKVIRIAYANAQTEDWAVPYGPDVIDGSSLTTRWLNSPTDPIYANRGHGYTTQKMIDAAVARADYASLNGQTYTNLRLTDTLAYFTFADVGKGVTGSGIPAGASIVAWVSRSEVTLSAATTATASGVSYTIKQRDTGLFDIAVAACPNQLIESAISQNGPDLDAAAAAAAGDADPNNYLARTVCKLVNTKWSARMVTTKNQLTAIIQTAPPTGDGGGDKSWQLLYTLAHQYGFFIAGQDLTRCSNDPAYQMNGGSAEDKENPGTFLTDEQISDRASTKLFSYGALYREIYDADAIALPGATKFAHDLFTGGSVVPPPPPTPGAPPPFQPIIRVVNFVAETLGGIAGLLGVDLGQGDLSGVTARSWISSINRYVRYAWRFHDWPELTLTEERAYRKIWNDGDPVAVNDEIFYLVDRNYYICILAGDAGILPTDTTHFTPITLTDRYVALDQACRMAIGEVYGVYDVDPRSNAYVLALDYRPSSRGIDVRGGNGATAFVRFKVRPSQFTATSWDANTIYAVGAPALWTDGQVYRALVPVQGTSPIDLTAWMLVPLPEILNPYVVFRSAADFAQDVQTGSIWRAEARETLEDEVDRVMEAGGINYYNFTAPAQRYLPLGTSSFWWSVSPPFDSSGASSVSTLTDVCLDAWGNVRIE